MPTDPPPGKRQNIAAAALLLGVILILFIAFAALSGAALGGSLTGERGVGHIFLLVVDTKFDSRIWVAVGGILGVGASYFAGGGLSDRLFYALTGLSFVTALLCLLFLVLLSDEQLSQAIYDYGSAGIADAESFHKAASWFLIQIALWLLGVLGMQVGVRKVGG